MKVNVERLTSDARDRLEDACVVDGLARHLPEAVRPPSSAWGPTSAGRLLEARWSNAWNSYEDHLYALRDRLSSKASWLAQTAADFAEAEIVVSAAVSDADEDGMAPSTTDDHVVAPGGDGFEADYRSGETAGDLPALLVPSTVGALPGRSGLDAFASEHAVLLNEAESLLAQHYGDDLSFAPPSRHLSDFTETDPNMVTSHIELTGLAVTGFTELRDGLESHSVRIPDYWESDASGSYLDLLADSRQTVSNLLWSLESSHDDGMAAASLLDDMLVQAVESATSPRADGQSHVQRIRQAVERIQDVHTDQRSHAERSGWESVNPGDDQELLDIAYRGLWQRLRGLSHSWNQCVGSALGEAETMSFDNMPPTVGEGSSEPHRRLDTVSETEEGELSPKEFIKDPRNTPDTSIHRHRLESPFSHTGGATRVIGRNSPVVPYEAPRGKHGRRSLHIDGHVGGRIKIQYAHRPHTPAGLKLDAERRPPCEWSVSTRKR